MDESGFNDLGEEEREELERGAREHGMTIDEYIAKLIHERLEKDESGQEGGKEDS